MKDDPAARARRSPGRSWAEIIVLAAALAVLVTLIDFCSWFGKDALDRRFNSNCHH